MPGRFTNAGTATYGIYNASKKWANGATWRDSNLEGTWSAAYDNSAPYAQLTLRGNTSGYKYWTTGLETLIQGWVSDEIRPNGVLIKQLNENVFNTLAFYSSSSQNPTTKTPQLTVSYTVPIIPEADCAQTVDGDTYESPSLDGMTASQIDAAMEVEENTCYVYGTPETCQTDPTVYVSAGCPALSPDSYDRGTGTWSDEFAPSGETRTCVNCKSTCVNCVEKTCTDYCESQASAMPGPYVGPNIQVPRTGAMWLLKQAFGNKVWGQDSVTTWEIPDIKKLAGALTVPMPDPDSYTAKKYAGSMYKLYQIYKLKTDTSPFILFRYGITRQANNDRLNKGSRRCVAKYEPTFPGAQCKGRYIMENILGYYRARMWEAYYMLLYKIAHDGRCPPGNPTCR